MKVFTAEAIRDAMTSDGICADTIFIADRHYAVPSVRWAGTFARALRTFYRELGIDRWEAERNDCDNFARGAAFFGDVLHRRSALGREVAFGLGEFWYCRQGDRKQAHAINVLLDKNGRPIFFEPQNVMAGRDPIIELTVEEKVQCIGYRF